MIFLSVNGVLLHYEAKSIVAGTIEATNVEKFLIDRAMGEKQILDLADRKLLERFKKLNE